MLVWIFKVHTLKQKKNTLENSKKVQNIQILGYLGTK